MRARSCSLHRVNFVFATYFRFQCVAPRRYKFRYHARKLSPRASCNFPISMRPYTTTVYITARYNMRIPCCPMPHHCASKLVFRLSIAHYLLFVTKIISLTFSLSRLFAVARIRVYVCIYMHTERA